MCPLGATKVPLCRLQKRNQRLFKGKKNISNIYFLFSFHFIISESKRRLILFSWQHEVEAFPSNACSILSSKMEAFVSSKSFFFNSFHFHHLCPAFLFSCTHFLLHTLQLFSSFRFFSLPNSSFTHAPSVAAARPPPALYSLQPLSEALFVLGSLFFKQYAVFQRAKKKINITVLSRPACVFEKMFREIQRSGFQGRKVWEKKHKTRGAGLWHQRISYIARILKYRIHVLYAQCVAMEKLSGAKGSSFLFIL